MNNCSTFIAAEELEFSEDDFLISLIIERRKLQIRTRNDLDIGALHIPEDSTWHHLYKHETDKALINVIGLNRQGFERLLKTFSRHYVVNIIWAEEERRPTKVHKSQALGMLLQFYSSAVELKSVAQLHGVRKDVASCILAEAEIAVENALQEERLSFILLPSKHLQAHWADKIKMKYPVLKRSFGFVDGKNYRVQEPREIDIKNAL